VNVTPVSDETGPSARSHLWPRTRAGRVATLLFVALMALAQWPFVFRFADRIEPWILGVPFLYAYLFFVYVALIAVLLWVWKRKL
jgi:hypothetical protein